MSISIRLCTSVKDFFVVKYCTSVKKSFSTSNFTNLVVSSILTPNLKVVYFDTRSNIELWGLLCKKMGETFYDFNMLL